MLRRISTLSLVLLGSCASGGNANVGAAVMMTAIAVGSSAASRAGGGCYAACPPGTTCNAGTGYCDTLPCRGACNSDQECDSTGVLDRCVPRSAVQMKINRASEGPATLTPR